MTRFIRLRTVAIIAALVAFGLPAPVAAAGKKDGIYKAVRSPLPYWRVGDVSRELSTLCSAGFFNQRVVYGLAGHFLGERGPYMMGAAKGTGENLHDPQARADERFDYWFLRDRTASCIVFTACVDKLDGRCVDGSQPDLTPGRVTPSRAMREQAGVQPAVAAPN